MLRGTALAQAGPTDLVIGAGEARGESGRNRRSKLHRLLFSDHVLAWTDQCLVSAMAFVVLAVIAWHADIAQVGIYAACSAILAVALAAQDALVTRPYTINIHRSAAPTAEHAFAALTLSFLLSLILMGLLGVVALSAWAIGAERSWVTMAWMLALAGPPVLMREFARRYAFAHLRVRQAFLLDATVVALNLGCLAGLAWSGQVTAVTALGTQIVSSAIGAAGWLLLVRSEFAPRIAILPEIAKRSWSAGKWLLSNQVALQAQGYTSHWLTLALLGAASTGIYTACASTVAIANPFVFGLINVMVPKSARSFAEAGSRGVQRRAALDALVLGGLMSAFCVALFLAGEEAMRILFHASGDNRLVLLLLGLGSLAGCIGVPASVALITADRARAVAFVTVTTAALNLGLALWLLPTLGLLGAAIAALAAETVGSIGRWAILLRISGRLDATTGSRTLGEARL